MNPLRALRIYQVDAFTSEPYRGNPAGVFPLEGPREEAWMQAVAAEMNLSETAFLWPEREGMRLRWFTPQVEVALCGHATLASAHVLAEIGIWETHSPMHFETLSGTLIATRLSGRGEPWIELDFPAMPVTETTLPEEVHRSFGEVPLESCWKTPDEHPGEHLYMLVLRSEEELLELDPDLDPYRCSEAPNFLATAPSDSPGLDFVSRFFAPGVGIDEDPVTGSAHCYLAPYWGRVLDRREMVGFQASERGGVVRVRVDGDRVALGGQAITVFSGDWHA